MPTRFVDRKTTTLVVPVREAEDAVVAWRSKHDWSATAGVPAHITLLGPFIPPEQVGPRTLERLRSLFASLSPVRFTLAGVARRSSLVYLAPEPTVPFEQLTGMLEAGWPEAPPFGHAFGRSLYHLTIARDAKVYDAIRADLGDQLPINATAREALLLERSAELEVRRIGQFPFGG